MKLPRDLSGDDLVRSLGRFGYVTIRQKGSHIRLSTQHGGEHHITIQRHDPIRIGTLTGILDSVAKHLGMTRESLCSILFEWPSHLPLLPIPL